MDSGTNRPVRKRKRSFAPDVSPIAAERTVDDFVARVREGWAPPTPKRTETPAQWVKRMRIEMKPKEEQEPITSTPEIEYIYVKVGNKTFKMEKGPLMRVSFLWRQRIQQLDGRNTIIFRYPSAEVFSIYEESRRTGIFQHPAPAKITVNSRGKQQITMLEQCFGFAVVVGDNDFKDICKDAMIDLLNEGIAAGMKKMTREILQKNPSSDADRRFLDHLNRGRNVRFSRFVRVIPETIAAPSLQSKSIIINRCQYHEHGVGLCYRSRFGLDT